MATLMQQFARTHAHTHTHGCSEKVFVSQERVSGFPEKGADLRGSPGTSGEVWGTSGEVWETSGEPLDCCLVPQGENFRGSRRKTSGEVPGKSGDFPEARGSLSPSQRLAKFVSKLQVFSTPGTAWLLTTDKIIWICFLQDLPKSWTSLKAKLRHNGMHREDHLDMFLARSPQILDKS